MKEYYMKNKIRFSYIFLLVTVLLLCLSIVSAHETTNTTDTPAIEENAVDVIHENKIVTTEDDVNDNKINKNSNTPIKTAAKKPVNFNIIVRNNIVDNSTIEVGVMDYNANKPIPNSDISLKLPDNTKINTKTLKSGYVNVTMKLPVSKNIVKISYAGTDDYYAYDYDLELNVIKRNANMQINAVKSNYTGNVNLTVKLTDSTNNDLITNAKTSLQLPDGRTLTQNTNSKAQAVYQFNLGAGKNNLNVTFPGNDKYNSLKANLTIDMGKVKSNVDYDVVLNSLYVGKTSISVTLKDLNTRKPMPNTPLQLTLDNGKVYSGKTDKNGVFTTNVDAPLGKNYMNITYKGNSTYNDRTSTINFTVSKRLSHINISLTDYNNPRLNITLKDYTLNKTVSNAPLTITLDNGSKITKNTDNRGNILYPITVPEGTKKVYKVTYAGSSVLTNASSSLTVIKEKPKIPVTYNITVLNRTYNNDLVQFKLIDTKTNKTIANAPLTIKLPQKTINVKTNNQGQINVKTNMTPGTNNITVMYDGNSQYYNRTSTVPITIDKRPSTINASIKVTDILRINATLSDLITKKPIANEKITLKHPKQNVTLTTDQNGRIERDIILPSGKAEISLLFNGNNIYYSSRVNPTNITLSPLTKVATKVTVNEVTGYMGDQVTLTAKITDIHGNPINMGNVVFKLNGNTLKTDNVFGSKADAKKIPVKNGIASVTLTADKVLRYANNLTVTYSGNDKYYKNVSNVVRPKIQFKKASLTVTATPKIQEHYQDITITVKIKDITDNKGNAITDHKDSYVFLKINGKTLKDSNSNTIKIKVVNQTATYTYKVPRATSGIKKDKSIRDHIITAVYYNPYYSVVNNETSFRVNRSPTHFDINTLEYNNKTRTLSISGNIKDYKNYNVLGNTEINIKINGKTLPNNNETVNYMIKEGKIDLKLNIPSSITKIKSVTLKCGNRLAYTNSTYETKTIKQV